MSPIGDAEELLAAFDGAGCIADVTVRGMRIRALELGGRTFEGVTFEAGSTLVAAAASAGSAVNPPRPVVARLAIAARKSLRHTYAVASP